MTDSGLSDIADAIEAGAELSAEQRRAVAAVLRQAVMMPASTFAQRDALLVECRRRFFSDRTDHDAAHEIAALWRRYETSAWRRDRSSETCPPRLVGTPHGALWEILKVFPRSLSAERIRKIVGHVQ